MKFFNINLYNQTRIVALTFSKIGSTNATGALTKKLFSNFPSHNILNIYDGNNDSDLQIHNIRYLKWNKSNTLKNIEYFNPNIMYIYMHQGGIHIMKLAKEIYEKYKIPFVIHIMDDYFDNLLKDSELYNISKFCIDHAYYCFSISDKMSDTYKNKFGMPFFTASNFINSLPSISKLSYRPDTSFNIKYFGNLDKKMSLDAVLDICQAIESMHIESITFDIYTYDYYHNLYSDKFKGEKIKLHHFLENYPECLQQADLLIMAYSFNDETKKYLHLSRAQKLPEYLASGRPVLAYGPADINTIEELQKYKCAKIVTIQDKNKLMESISTLYESEDLRLELALKAREIVKQYFSPELLLKNFEEKILYTSINYNHDSNCKNTKFLKKINIKSSTKKQIILEKIKKLFTKMKRKNVLNAINI